MPALAPYIPAKDAALSNWAANFSTLISASPGTYGLASADAADIATVVNAFIAAYALVTSPTTKTAATVAAKNTARTTMLGVVRPYAQQISLNAGVTTDNKIAVGVNPRTSTPSPVTPPTSNPILTVQSLSNLSCVFRYRDSAASVSVKAKPYGVTSCAVYGMASAAPITDPTKLPLIANATKSPFVFQFASGDAGMIFYTAARWQTRTGGFSPWSPVGTLTVPAVGG